MTAHEGEAVATHIATRETLRRVATHVLARTQHASTGRIGLRPSPGGFATTEFGASATRIRVSGATLLVESTADPGASSRAMAIEGATLAELADFAGADIVGDFSAGTDTPPLGDPREVLHVASAPAELLGRWYGVVAEALDTVVAGGPPWRRPSRAQLWPEHFDLALDLAFDETSPMDHRVNLGGSPGDPAHPMPYLYIGPWTTDRPGEGGFWNAPFGAVLGSDLVLGAGSPVEAAARFLDHGLGLLAR